MYHSSGVYGPGYITYVTVYPYVSTVKPPVIMPAPAPPPVPQRRHKGRSPRKSTNLIIPTPRPQPEFTSAQVENCLRYYLLQPKQLKSLGYPVESNIYPGKAVIYPPYPPFEPMTEPRCSDSGSSGSDEAEDDASLTDRSIRSEERRCMRCGRGFFLLRDKYLTTERCVYHWGKPHHHMGYSCCQGRSNSEGCSSAKLHVWSGIELGVNGPLDGFVVTKEREVPSSGYGAYAIDCEMCFTSDGLELCKVSVVNMNGTTIYDTYVKPSNAIVDYNTRFSGITSKHLQKNSAVKTLEQVQKDILEFVSADTILIGHGLENDLKALKIIHRTVVDTSVAFPHHFGLPYRRSLRSLVSTLLNRDIQTEKHDSAEDALACVQLMHFRMSCDFNRFPIKSL